MLLDHLGESLVAFWALPGCMIERAHFSFARGLFKRRCMQLTQISFAHTQFQRSCRFHKSGIHITFGTWHIKKGEKSFYFSSPPQKSRPRRSKLISCFFFCWSLLAALLKSSPKCNVAIHITFGTWRIKKGEKTFYFRSSPLNFWVLPLR